MRLPLPTRISLRAAVIFIVLFFAVQLVERTDLIFAGLCSVYFALFFLAFTLCRGLENPAGAWVFFYGLGTAVIGLVGKAILGEAAQTHLNEPVQTMTLYCAGMGIVGVGAYLGLKLARKPGYLEDFLEGEALHRAAIGCFVLGTFLTFMGNIFTVNETNGSIGSVLQQFNQFNRVAMLLDVYYVVRKTNGQRNYTWVVLGSGFVLFLIGLLAYSKEGLFFPFVAWILAAMMAGARFSRTQIIGGIFVAFFLVYYMVPYSQYGRKSRGEANQYALVASYLGDLEGTRKAYLQTEETAGVDSEFKFYDAPQGLLDRENMLAFDDGLIAYTDAGNVNGLFPEVVAFANIIPHFLWPNKPSFFSGNEYGRELGVIDSEDETTGISFSPMADAYHQATWLGVLLVLPAVVFLYAFTSNSVVGSMRNSPWALLPVAISASNAPEGLLAGNIYIATTLMAEILVIAFVAKHVLPLALGLVIGEKRDATRRRLNFTPAKRRTALLDTVATDPGSGQA